MADDAKLTIESYVGTALRKRFADASTAAGTAREQILGALERLNKALAEAGDARFDLPAELIPAPPPPPAAAEVGLISHILSAQRELVAATDQVGLLTQLLLGCTVSCPRVAFFILKKDALAGWAARGFERAQDADVRSLSVPVAEDTILGAACRTGVTVRARPGTHSQDRQFLSRLGGDMPADAMAIPIWIRDKVAAVLYGDAGRDDEIIDPEVPEILGLHAGLCLETLATRQKYPRQKPGETSGSQPVASQPAPASPSSSVSPSGPISVIGTSSPAVAPAPVAPASSSAGFTASAAPSASVPRPVIVPSPAPQPQAPVPSPRPVPQVATPSLESLPEEDRKLHEEARRFARLLVSEIVLYNERQVEEGRRQKDLYERLKEDIDRSRGMYDQRVSAKVRAATSYFYQELVRTLANGDESAMKVPWA